MYTENSSVTLAGLTEDKQGYALTVDTFTTSGGTPTASTVFNGVGNNYISQSSTNGTGTGLKVEITTDASSVVSGVKIADPGQGHAVGDVITFTNFDGATADATIRIASIGDTIGGMPVDAINTTFSVIKNIGIDSFCGTPSVSSYHFISS